MYRLPVDLEGKRADASEVSDGFVEDSGLLRARLRSGERSEVVWAGGASVVGSNVSMEQKRID